MMRVLVHEASALPAGRRKKVRLLKEGYFQIVMDIVASILAAGCKSPGAEGAASLDPAEVERVTYSVFGMLNWSYGWYDPHHHGTPQDVARTIHAVAVCGLVARCPHRSAQGNLERYLGAIAPPPLIGKTGRAWQHQQTAVMVEGSGQCAGHMNGTQSERGPEKCGTEKQATIWKSISPAAASTGLSRTLGTLSYIWAGWA
jgi:hypothetical protein